MDFETKVGLGIFLGGALSVLAYVAVIVGVVYTGIHFILKFW